MVAVAIFSTDPVLRRNLEQLPHDDSAVALVGIVDHPSSVPELLNQDHVDVLLADAPTRELLAEYRGRHDRIALVVLLDGVDAADRRTGCRRAEGPVDGAAGHGVVPHRGRRPRALRTPERGCVRGLGRRRRRVR